MMKNYEIHTLKDEEDMFFWCVWEKASEQAIDFFYFKEDAEDCAKFLENGGAFAGFTPGFILKEMKLQRNVDQEFTKLLST
jgi:Tat protein secretion system quality control protein TatD with DNase activity